MRTRALALGKFAPLHRGHQLVLDRATVETDEQVFVIYDSPKVTSIPLPARASWLRKLYPAARVVEAWNGPEEVGQTPEIIAAHNKYLLEDLGLEGITHFYSSEPYGDHVAKALDAVDVRVDEQRSEVPISATDVRMDYTKFREFVDPIVARDLVRKVVFVGAPSSGKTTIAEACARQIGGNWMPEYGREYWEKHNRERRLTLGQLAEIAIGHIDREEELFQTSDGHTFIDTNAMTTAVFSDYYHGAREPSLSALAAQCSGRYDVTFLCDIDIPFEDTEDRSGPGNRLEFHKRTIAALEESRIPFITLRGTVAERVYLVRRFLAENPMFCNPADWRRDA
jgi:HTH-type transcriptional repressor of NAD biosynthesis genes